MPSPNHDYAIEPFYAHLGERLRDIRIDRGLTQKQLGAGVGMHTTTITHFEKGNSRIRSLDLVRICLVLGVDIGALLNEMTAENPELFGPDQPFSMSAKYRAARSRR